MNLIQQDLLQHGFHMLRHVLSDADINALIDHTAALAESSPHGIRNLRQKSAFVKHFLDSNLIRNMIVPIAGYSARVVRVIYFDKLPEANWNVGWLQDSSIAVKQKIASAGFTRWTRKQGVAHVEPPLTVLQNMLTLRIHLDDCDADNGALQVIAGSHRRGLMNANDIAQQRQKKQTVLCSSKAGDVLLMRPLLLHASRKSVHAKHRRVIHVEFASCDLPRPLQWFEQSL